MNWVTEFWMSDDHKDVMMFTLCLVVVATIAMTIEMLSRKKGTRQRKMNAQITLGIVASTVIVVPFSFLLVPVIIASGVLFLAGRLVYEAFAETTEIESDEMEGHSRWVL